MAENKIRDLLLAEFERQQKQKGIVVRKTAQAKPPEILAFEEERRYIRSRRYTRTRRKGYYLNFDLATRYREMHFEFAEQCEKNPELYKWIEDLDAIVARDNESIEDLNRDNKGNKNWKEVPPFTRHHWIEFQGLSYQKNLELIFHSVASYNKKLPDS